MPNRSLSENSPLLPEEVTLHRLLNNSAFQPEVIAELVSAYHAAVRELQAEDAAEGVSTDAVAATVIDIARSGARDSAMIAAETVARLRK
jgi:hypothetical protein